MIGISSYKYFGKPRTPDGTAADMWRALRFYMKKWNKRRVVLVGYSLGAEIIPFVATRVPEDLRDRVVMVVMLGPSAETMFEYHLMDWLLSTKNRPTFSVTAEIDKIQGPKVLCVTSALDRKCICEKLEPGRVTVLKRAGGHHYNSNYLRLTEAIMEELKKAAEPANLPAVP
jgi:type IV secretory pathway VirJ component